MTMKSLLMSICLSMSKSEDEYKGTLLSFTQLFELVRMTIIFGWKLNITMLGVSVKEYVATAGYHMFLFLQCGGVYLS